MRKVNFDSIDEHVDVQYNDLTGIIKIDGHENITSIYNLCRDYKFDTSDIFIIGFGLTGSEMGVGEKECHCTILYVQKKEYGSTFDEIEKKVSLEGKVIAHKKQMTVKYADLLKYVKRFDFLATSEITKHATSIEIIEQD